MAKKRTQIFKVGDVPKEYVKLFNSLAGLSSNGAKTEADILVEMMELYARSRIGDRVTDIAINSHKRPYEHE